MHTEEYPPQITPTIRGPANSRMEDTPRINSTNTMINVVREVLMLRDNVCVILLFTTSFRSVSLRRLHAQILTDTIEDNDGRVDRITYQSQHAGDECAAHRCLGQCIKC